MKTKPVSTGGGGGGGGAGGARPRERRRPPSAQSAHADTPTNDKDGTTHGKFAGISPESIQIMSEQIPIENLTEDACTLLAEDLSYKLRQLIHNVALHARNTKTQCVTVEDVNIVLKLMDNEPVLGAAQPQWVPIVEAENLCTTYDTKVDLVALATQPLNLLTVPPPTISATWITGTKSFNGNSKISSNLHNYYTKISKALLSGNRQLVRVALRDISTNCYIGPIIPNIMNLSLLILSDPMITPMSHEILHKQALNILDTLLTNPCCYDTDVTLQLHRLFPILVSNVLTESILSEQILRIMASVVTVWPQFAYIGRNIVLEYLSQGVQERLTGPLVECLTALGKKALLDGLTYHMPLIESMTCIENEKLYSTGLHTAIVNASYEFLKITEERFDPKIAYIDKYLYEILGDTVIPRRLLHLLPVVENIKELPSSPKHDFDSSPYSPPKPTKKKPKFKIVKHFPQEKNHSQYYNSIFEDANEFGLLPRFIQFNVARCRQLQTQPRRNVYQPVYPNYFQNGDRYNPDKKYNVILANGILLRFKYRLPNEKRIFPNYNFYTL